MSTIRLKAGVSPSALDAMDWARWEDRQRVARRTLEWRRQIIRKEGTHQHIWGSSDAAVSTFTGVPIGTVTGEWARWYQMDVAILGKAIDRWHALVEADLLWKGVPFPKQERTERTGEITWPKHLVFTVPSDPSVPSAPQGSKVTRAFVRSLNDTWSSAPLTSPRARNLRKAGRQSWTQKRSTR